MTQLLLTQLSVQLDAIPVAFRCGFVLFLFAVMLLMKDDKKKDAKQSMIDKQNRP